MMKNFLAGFWHFNCAWFHWQMLVTPDVFGYPELGYESIRNGPHPDLMDFVIDNRRGHFYASLDGMTGHANLYMSRCLRNS